MWFQKRHYLKTYLSMLWNVSLKNLRKLDKWRRKESWSIYYSPKPHQKLEGWLSYSSKGNYTGTEHQYKQNPNVKFLVQILISMYCMGNIRSECLQPSNTMEVLSWFRAAFQSMVLGILSKLNAEKSNQISIHHAQYHLESVWLSCW